MIFCVGTALKTAVSHGIIPDFAVVIETSPACEIQLNIPELEQINLIVGTNSYPGVFDLKPKRFFNYHPNKTAATKHFGQILGVPIDSYEVAGTVSITSLYSARMLGCDKIILIGQDLAYTDNQCYSKSSVYGNYKLDESKKIFSEDDNSLQKQLGWQEKNISSHKEVLTRDLCTIKGINGENLVTRPDFMLFCKYFEEIARNYGAQLKLINATEYGAYIEGFEHLPLTEALEKYAKNETFNAEDFMQNSKIGFRDIKKRKKIVQNSLYEVIKKYSSIKNIISLQASSMSHKYDLSLSSSCINNPGIFYYIFTSVWISETCFFY